MGCGSLAAKLREEVDFDSRASDGHVTGLAVIALRDAVISAEDSRIEVAVQWVKQNQRVLGRWRTCSLNNDGIHYFTYSNTAYALLTLAKRGTF